MKIKIGVVANKGGVAKTTISHLLGLGFKRMDFEVAVCVTDPEREVELFNDATRPYAIMDARTKKSFSDTITFANDFQVENLAIVIDGAGNKTEYYPAIAANTDVVLIPFGSGYIDMTKAADDIRSLRSVGAKRIRLVRSRWSPAELTNVDTNKLMNDIFGEDAKLILDFTVTETSGKDKPLRRLTMPDIKFQHVVLDAEGQIAADAVLATAEEHKVGYISSYITKVADDLTACLMSSLMQAS